MCILIMYSAHKNDILNALNTFDDFIEDNKFTTKKLTWISANVISCEINISMATGRSTSHVSEC